MPEEPTGIRETLHAAAQSDQTTPTAQSPTPDPTPSPAPADDQPQDGLEGNLLKQFEKELTKLDPAERKTLIKKLASSDRKLQETLRASAGLRKFAERLSARFPDLTSDEVLEAMTAHRTRSSSKTNTVETRRGIDALIERTTDPATREELRESKRIMHEEFEEKLTRAVEDAVGGLRREIDDLKSAGLSERSSVVEAEIDALSDEEGFPDSFVEKYREDLRLAAIRYRLPVLEVLPKVVPYADLKAVFAEVKPPSSSLPHTPKTPTAPIGPTSTSSAPKNLEAHKDKRGGWDLRGALKALARV